jgi:plastocyanin
MKTYRTTALLLGALVVMAALLLAACGGDSGNGGGAYGGGGAATTPAGPSASPAGGTAVTIRDFAFGPDKLEVPVGSTVTWTNEDGVQHTVTSAESDDVDAATTGLFDSGLLSQGDTFSFTFEEAGTYYYLCTPHASMPSMHAEIEVE